MIIDKFQSFLDDLSKQNYLILDCSWKIKISEKTPHQLAVFILFGDTKEMSVFVYDSENSATSQLHRRKLSKSLDVSEDLWIIGKDLGNDIQYLRTIFGVELDTKKIIDLGTNPYRPNPYSFRLDPTQWNLHNGYDELMRIENILSLGYDSFLINYEEEEGAQFRIFRASKGEIYQKYLRAQPGQKKQIFEKYREQCKNVQEYLQLQLKSVGLSYEELQTFIFSP